MYNGQKVIDVHGHFSAPPELNQFSMSLINLRQPDTWVWRSGDGSGRLVMSDESFEGPIRRHLQAMDERNIDIQLISNHPVHMWHWETPEVQQIWCRTVNDAIAQKVRLRPDRFIGVGQLPQNAQLDTTQLPDRAGVLHQGSGLRRRHDQPGPRRGPHRAWHAVRILVSALREGGGAGCHIDDPRVDLAQSVRSKASRTTTRSTTR